MGNPEKDIAEKVLAGSGVTASKLGLRFDRVVVRVLGDLRAFAESAVPEGSAIVVTISAPIRLPAKMVDAAREKIAELKGDWSGTLHGNQVSLRLERRSANKRPKLVGFVHNPSIDATELLDLAERWLAQ